MSGENVPNVSALLKSMVEERPRAIHVGTDSQQNGKHTEFVCVIVVLDPGKGGRAFYSREKVDRIKSLRERLLKEAWMSLSTAIDVHGLIDESNEIVVHLDVNPSLDFKSGEYAKELAGMVASQGFTTLLKPESWCAAHVADHVVKHKVIKPDVERRPWKR